MVMGWKKKEKRPKTNPDNSFKTHNEKMSSFFRKHQLSLKNGPKNQSANFLLERTRPFQIRYAIAQTGGLNHSINDRDTLIRLSRNIPRRISQN